MNSLQKVVRGELSGQEQAMFFLAKVDQFLIMQAPLEHHRDDE